MQTDWGGEYQKLNAFFKQIGIAHHVSCPHTHQQNGSAKRKHRHIVDVGLSLLAHACMPLRFWDEAVITACFLINRLPSRTIQNTTPLNRLFNTSPDYSFLRTFGCACWPCLRRYNNNKLQFRSKRCVFLGYSPLHKGYKCLHVSSGRLYISRDVVFDENCFPFSTENPSSTPPELLAKLLATPPLEPLGCTDTTSSNINNGLLDTPAVCTDLASQPIFPVSDVQVTGIHGATDPGAHNKIRTDPVANSCVDPVEKSMSGGSQAP